MVADKGYTLLVSSVPDSHINLVYRGPGMDLKTGIMGALCLNGGGKKGQAVSGLSLLDLLDEVHMRLAGNACLFHDLF